MVSKHPAVYIVSSLNRTIYIGVTSDLAWRIWKHKTGVIEGFSKKYNVNRLVYFERFTTMPEAIAREKQLQKWRREKKVWLIERSNLGWEDLAEQWYEDTFWCVRGFELTFWEPGVYNPGVTKKFN